MLEKMLRSVSSFSQDKEKRLFALAAIKKSEGMQDTQTQQGVHRLNVLDLQRQMRSCPKPVIAMVAGYAIGGGHVLHVVCDLTHCSG